MRFKLQYVILQLLKMIIIITTTLKNISPCSVNFSRAYDLNNNGISLYYHRFTDAMCSIIEEEEGGANSVRIWEPDPLIKIRMQAHKAMFNFYRVFNHFSTSHKC